MKSLLLFFSALSEPLSLRLLALLQHRTHSVTDLAGVLNASPAVVAQKLKQFSEVGLIKVEAESDLVRLRTRHAQVVKELFTHFGLTVKKDITFREDDKAAKAHREAKRKAEKELKKDSSKKDSSKKDSSKKASRKPSVKVAARKKRPTH
jgi:DNA-binding transcriptional ArsR family regulator